MGVIARSVDFVAAAIGPGFVQRISLPAGFDVTPKAFRLLIFGTTTDGSVTQSIRFSEGWYDGTNSWCLAGRVLYTAGTGDNDSYATADTGTDRVGVVITTNAQTLDDYAEFSAWGTALGVGYVDIQWNDAAAVSSAWRCRLTAWAGDDLTVEVGTHSTSGDVVGTEETVTVATGLVPQAIRVLGCGATLSTGDNYGANFRFGGGWGVSDGAATPALQQFAHGWFYTVGGTNPWAGGIIECSEESGGTARIYAQGDDTTSGSGLLELELTDVDSGSWKYTPRGTAQTKTFGYVVFDVESAIELGINYYEQIGSTDPGYDSTPDVSYTSVLDAATFEPQHVDWTASDMPDTGYNRGNLCASMNPYGAADIENLSAGSMFSFIGESRGTDNFCYTYYDSAEFIHVIEEDGATLRWSADVGAFIATGIRLTIGTIPLSTTKVNASIAWGIESSPVTLSAEVASSAATALDPTLAIGLKPGFASVTATALDPTKAIGLNVSAAAATRTWALDPSLSIGLKPGTASASATALDPTKAIGLNTTAAATGALALDPSLSIGLKPGVASSAATALDASLSVGLKAGVASSSATALDPSLSIGLLAGVATVAATAPSASISRFLRPGVATVSATALSASVGKVLRAGVAEVTAVAEESSLRVDATVAAGVAEVAATALDPTILADARLLADEAVVTATALDPTLSIGPLVLQAGVAEVAAIAEEPVLVISQVLLPAQADVTATALDPTLAVGAVLDASEATAAATALDPALSIGLKPGVAFVNAVALGPILSTPGGPIQLQAGLATVSAGALTAILIRPGALIATGRAETTAPGWERGQITAPGFGRLQLAASYWGRGQNNGR